jgi:hypothetical protein
MSAVMLCSMHSVRMADPTTEKRQALFIAMSSEAGAVTTFQHHPRG